jgi:hypothetical protein
MINFYGAKSTFCVRKTKEESDLAKNYSVKGESHGIFFKRAKTLNQTISTV